MLRAIDFLEQTGIFAMAFAGVKVSAHQSLQQYPSDAFQTFVGYSL
jgi:hypothetical protein